MELEASGCSEKVGFEVKIKTWFQIADSFVEYIQEFDFTLCKKKYFKPRGYLCSVFFPELHKLVLFFLSKHCTVHCVLHECGWANNWSYSVFTFMSYFKIYNLKKIWKIMTLISLSSVDIPGILLFSEKILEVSE